MLAIKLRMRLAFGILACAIAVGLYFIPELFSVHVNLALPILFMLVGTVLLATYLHLKIKVDALVETALSEACAVNSKR